MITPRDHDSTPVRPKRPGELDVAATNRDETSVRVAVRVRPQLPGEDMRVCLFKTKGQPQLVLGKERSFTFDHVFDQKSRQDQVHSSCVTPLVDAFFQGFNATVFAYGQTGSGKTFTMGSASPGAIEQRGIIPRAIDEIFARVEKLKATHRFSLRISFLEIYNEEIRDLLDATKGKPLKVREDADGGASVQGAEEERVSAAEQMMQALHRGSLVRMTGATNMNEVSSRSHAIFTIIVDMCKLASLGSPGPHTPASEAGRSRLASGGWGRERVWGARQGCSCGGRTPGSAPAGKARDVKRPPVAPTRARPLLTACSLAPPPPTFAGGGHDGRADRGAHHRQVPLRRPRGVGACQAHAGRGAADEGVRRHSATSSPRIDGAEALR